jgi:hypothetical protein
MAAPSRTARELLWVGGSQLLAEKSSLYWVSFHLAIKLFYGYWVTYYDESQYRQLEES